jgi:hypothetical protein
MLRTAVAFLLTVLLWQPNPALSGTKLARQRDGREEVASAGSQIVEIEGQRYRFPAYASVMHFSDQHTKAVEVGLRSSFWAMVFEPAGPVPWWVSTNEDTLGSHYITKPSETFQWRFERAAPLPPVRGPVELFAYRAGVRFWWSRDPKIAVEGLLYITFDGRPDLYGECTDKDVGDETRSCTLYWLDRGLVHRLWMPGSLIDSAPRIADQYRRIVKVG